ncbi:MAG: transposase [Candidatus Omnitrophota bacterium]
MEGEKGKKRRFDWDFKLSAVKMVTEGGHKVTEVARSLDIDVNRLYLWKKQLGDNGDKAFPGKGHLIELAAFRRQLQEVEIERDILKKQSAYFQNRPGTVLVHRREPFGFSARQNVPGIGSIEERVLRIQEAV